MRSFCFRNDTIHEAACDCIIKCFENTKNLMKEILSAHFRMHDYDGILTKQGSMTTGWGGIQEICKWKVQWAENHGILAPLCLEEVSLMDQHKYLFVSLSLSKIGCIRLTLSDATGS